MKRRFKAVTCALVAVLSLSVVVDGPKLGPFGVDVVSAATGATTPATSNTSTKGAYILKIGSKGSNVKLIQTMLNNKGYMLEVDGIFGNLTLNAVKDFQSKNGLTVDGVVGPKTYEKLKAEPTVQPEPPAQPEPTTPPAVPEPTTTPDVVSSASIVDNAADFEKAISKDGKWIIATLNDLTFDKELVLDGEFKNGKKDADGNDVIQRKIGLYTQDEKRNVTASFTLTAPKLTINSLNARIQSGTFKGDLYVSAANFQLVNAKVEGNVYFTTQEAKDTFKMDEKSSITGKQELLLADVVTTASIVDNAVAFEKGISKDGKWIICTLNDLTIDKELVLDGEFKNGKKDANGNDVIQRKIALYTQDEDHNITASFSLTAPKLTINSPNARIQGGTFKGDLYVSAANFQLVKAKVEGNVYFTTQEAKDTFKMDDVSSITGKQELMTN